MRAYSTRFIAREHAGLIEAANRGLDTTGLALAALIVTYGFPHAADRPTRDWILLVLLNLLCNLLIFQQSGLYRSWRGRPFSDQLGRLMLAGLGASLITFFVWAALNLLPAARRISNNCSALPPSRCQHEAHPDLWGRHPRAIDCRAGTLKPRNRLSRDGLH